MSDEDRGREAAMRAAARVSTDDARDEIIRSVMGYMDHQLTWPGVSATLSEVLRQGAVLLWSAFEVLARDLFVLVLNRRPDIAAQLLLESCTSRIFDMKRIPTDLLVEHGFDLRERMGTLLLSRHDLGNFREARVILQHLFGLGRDGQSAVLSPALWLLNQRRNLVVHRRGIVDAHYISETPDTRPLGQSLELSAGDLQEHLRTVQAAGGELIDRAGELLS